MSAEEYIQSESTTFESPNIDSTTEIVETFIAKKAIEMARQEERKKAIETFKAVSMIIMSPFVSDGKLDKAANDLVDIVTELLNQ